MTPDEFRRDGHRLIDWIADYRAGVAERPVMAQVEPGEIRAQLPATPPEQPEPFDAVLARPRPRSSCRGSPTGSTRASSATSRPTRRSPSVLGDYLSTGLGVLGLSWQSSPALTELEEVVTDWVRQMVGLSDAWSGVIQDTASTSTLVALLCARERTTDYALARGGLQAEARAAGRLHLAPEPQLGREGGAARRASAARTCGWCPRRQPTPCAPTRSTRRSRRDLARGPAPLRRRRHDRHHDDHRHRPARRDRRGGAGARALAARRRRDGRLGDDPARMPLDVGRASRAPTRWSSTRTSGSARRSTARSTTSATPSTWSG